MRAAEKSSRLLEEMRVNVRVKISALWAAVMFLFIYVDHFALFIPGVLADATGGNVGGFEVSQGTLVAGMLLMVIPSLMIFLTVVLNPRASRWANIIIAIVYIGVVIANVIGESWAYYIGASVIEAVLLGVIVVYAWKWQRVSA